MSLQIHKWVNPVFVFPLIFLLATGRGSLSFGAAESVTKVFAEASAEVEKGARTEAAKAAGETALKSAVLQIIEQQLPRDVVDSHRAEIEEKILSHAADYVRTYQVMTERLRGTKLTVKISAEVWSDPVFRDVRALGIAPAGSENSAKVVQLVVARPEPYRLFVQFRKVLQEEIKGIQQIRTVSIDRSSIGLALELAPAATAESIQRELESRKYEGRMAKIVRVGEDRLEVRF